MEINELIQNGIQALAKRDLLTAREYFKMAIEMDRQNESAWMWMSKAVTEERNKVICLTQVLKINPNNQAATTDLQKVTSKRIVSAITPPVAPPLRPAIPQGLPTNSATKPTIMPVQASINQPGITGVQPQQANVIEANRQYVCPICKRADAIRRVISIVNEETERTSGTNTTTSETSISGKQHHWGENEYHFPKYMGTTNISGSGSTVGTTVIDLTRQSDLAAQLMAPVKPTEPALHDTGCVDLLMLLGVPLISIVITLYIFFSSYTVNSYGRRGLDWGTFVLLPIFIIIGELLLYFVWRRPAAKEAKKRYLSDIQLYEQNELEDWKQKMVIWERLYYCARDHVVFDPINQQYRDPRQTSTLIA
jgi:hypothetical protein